jgi:GT2 family glycosyltransferase
MAKVSVIIVNWNGKELLKTCLDSLETQTFRDFKVVLVDNGSNDGSVEFVRENYPQVEIITLDKNYGFARGNNIGIEEALKDRDVRYVALLNNDTKVDKNWLQELIKVAESDGKIGSCQSKMLFMDNPRVIDGVGIGINQNGLAYQIGWREEDNGQYENTLEVFGACACAVLCRKEMLVQIELFDEDFFAYYEDVDLALRARLAGWRCMYVPKAVVYHKHSATYVKDAPLKMYFVGRNKYYYIIKNFPTGFMFKFLIGQARIIILMVLSIIKRTMLRDTKSVRLSCSYLKRNLDAFKNIPKMFTKRKRIRSARLISDEELMEWFK